MNEFYPQLKPGEIVMPGPAGEQITPPHYISHFAMGNFQPMAPVAETLADSDQISKLMLIGWLVAKGEPLRMDATVQNVFEALSRLAALAVKGRKASETTDPERAKNPVLENFAPSI